jgi:hypothetical protein
MFSPAILFLTKLIFSATLPLFNMTQLLNNLPTPLKIFLSIILLLSIGGVSALLGWTVAQKTDRSDKTQTVVQTEQDIQKNTEIVNTIFTDEEAKVIKADEIKTEPVTTTTANQTTKTEAQKTYTNQFFPNLKLVYPESWQFKTETSKSNVEGLVNRKITLSKNGTELTIFTSPLTIWDCGGGQDTAVPKPTFSSKNEINEYSDQTNQELYYTKNYFCGDIFRSNIPQNSIKEFLDLGYDRSDGVYFTLFRSTNIKSSEIYTNPQLAEVRLIIENSTF